MAKTAMCLILIAALTLPAVGANHVQTATTTGGQTVKVVFDHIGGDEYWVEARITSTHPITMANFRTEKGTFHDFSRSGWDPNVYVIGARVPPGERVQFQVMTEDASGWINSCLFTHPAGLEDCNNAASGPFFAHFRNPSGNEWWQQVYVDTNRPLNGVAVDIMETTAASSENFLEKRSWGAYAGSYYAPAGSIVRFRAFSGDEAIPSGCFRWPEATPVACPDGDANRPHFDHIKGNEWWVEVKTGPYEPSAVFARDTDGAWVQLTKRSWGVWAGSFHIEPGHQVIFQAHVDGQRYVSCWFTHPGGGTPEGDQVCRGGHVGPVNPHQ